MIFIGLFFGIITIVISLNIYNHMNLDKIEDYLINIDCKDFMYSKGTYKAFCEDKLIEIKNSFILDLENNKILEIDYKDIEKFDILDNDLNIRTVDNNFKMEFKEKVDLNEFTEKLNNKLIGK